MRRHRKRPGKATARNPRFDLSLKRSERVPLTLIDASSRANAARDLRVLAASIHAWRPCHAQIIQKFATEIEQSYTAAAAIAAMTSVPQPAGAPTEITMRELTVAERAMVEITFLETSSAPA